MDPHNSQPPPVWSGTRAGSRRWPPQDTPERSGNPHRPPRSVPPPQDPAAAGGQAPSIAGLLLRPGATVVGVAVAGADAAGSINTHTSSYTLQSQLHQGPRSAVWRAADSSSQTPVVLKVLGTSSAKQRAAAMHELLVLQQLAAPVAQDAARQPDGPAAAAGTRSHLVQLLDALLVPQHSHKPRATPASKGGASAPLDDQGVSPDGAAAVLLVLAPLHQSLAWVLHWVQQRHGRAGLPPSAVRSLAHQLLTGLAELHDGQALTHRDVKPSNLLLQQPFVVRTRKNLMRNMSLQELSSAQWSLADMGSAGRLLPPPQSPAAQVQDGSAPTAGQPRSWLQSLWEGWRQQQHGTAAAVPADTPSQQRWQVAAGDVPGYETAPYSPPEAILHLPATAAYDVWSAACLIYEAATGRVLFPLEAAAAERRCILARSRQQSGKAAGSSSSEADDDRATQLDGLHLAMIRGVSGRPPAQLLACSSVAEELYADTATGVLWLSDEEEEGWPSPGAAQALQSSWRPRFCRPLLHHLMARRSMPLEQAVELAELLEPMLAWEPGERPTAAQLLQHKFFQPLQLR